jgi:hypothetical protein
MEIQFQLSKNHMEFQEELRSLETQYFLTEMEKRGQDMTRVMARALKNQRQMRMQE